MNISMDHFYEYGWIIIPTWLINYIHYKMLDEITYAFQNFKGYSVEVWEWISDLISHFTGNVITYP